MQCTRCDTKIDNETNYYYIHQKCYDKMRNKIHHPFDPVSAIDLTQKNQQEFIDKLMQEKELIRAGIKFLQMIMEGKHDP